MHLLFTHTQKKKRMGSSFALPASVKDVSIYLDNRVKNQGISYDPTLISISKTSWPPYLLHCPLTTQLCSTGSQVSVLVHL